MPENYEPGWETDFERGLELELHRMLDPVTAGPIPIRSARPAGGNVKKLLGGAGAAIGVKVLTGFVVAAAAATFAVAAGEAAMKGGVNPLSWGQQVKQQVSDCKASAARLAVHGSGQCVAPPAQEHGAAVTDSPKATGETGSPDKTEKSETDGGSGKHTSQDDGHGSDKLGSEHPIATAGEPTDPPMVGVHAPIPPQE